MTLELVSIFISIYTHANVEIFGWKCLHLYKMSTNFFFLISLKIKMIFFLKNFSLETMFSLRKYNIKKVFLYEQGTVLWNYEVKKRILLYVKNKTWQTLAVFDKPAIFVKWLDIRKEVLQFIISFIQKSDKICFTVLFICGPKENVVTFVLPFLQGIRRFTFIFYSNGSWASKHWKQELMVVIIIIGYISVYFFAWYVPH